MARDPNPEKWLNPIKDGKFPLTIEYLAGLVPGAPTQKNPVVKCGRGHIQKTWKDLDSRGVGLNPPHQPFILAYEGDNIVIENVIKEWMYTFPGAGGLNLKAIKLYETFSYSESSQLHGNMLQKQSHQRNQAKELLNTIQGIKTAILNIESDIEKLDEQLTAFKSGDWEKVKWLFIDNYGGPDRSWTAVARQVPLVRMSMTWFLRLKTLEKAPLETYIGIMPATPEDQRKLEELEKQIGKVSETNKQDYMKQIDTLVKDEQINPAIANHLKSKVQEFWNWVGHYASWLKKSRDKVRTNLVHQKTNMKMYMKWAADAIYQGERMDMNHVDYEKEMVDFAFRYTPREFSRMEYICAGTYDQRPEISERCKPWLPVILTKIDVGTTVELQKKFSQVAFTHINGYMHKMDMNALTKHLEGGSKDLVGIMLRSGAMTKEEIQKMFTTEELKVLKGETKLDVELSGEEKRKMTLSKIANNLVNTLKIFGISVSKENMPWTYEMRAAAYAYELTLLGLEMFKKSVGMLSLK
ncbi:MAG TPA: hypothetical protein ENN60_01510 [archaeon]|nr:hypothetical protein [archaeon]